MVEVKGIAKPVIACATNIQEKITVYTSSVLASKARENILEFILINHPIDCPICDQGGECDLQDQYIIMGSLASRFYESYKKGVSNKNLSHIIKLSLNKCINCSRCTRFSHQVLGNYSFTILNRGEKSAITNYLKNLYVDELSSNVMDICPVGASTSKIISYDVRVWDYIDLKFVDFSNVIHQPIRMDFRGLSIQRILPLIDFNTEEEWITDKIRYSFRLFEKNKFFLPKIKKLNKFRILSWKKFNSIFIKNFIRILSYFYNKKRYFNMNLKICENSSDIYVYNYFKFFNKINSITVRSRVRNCNLFRNLYLIKNKDLDFIDAENFLLINTNLRSDFPIINFKIREKFIYDFTDVFIVGNILNLNYYFKHVSNNLLKCKNLLKYKNFFKKKNIYIFSKSKENFLLNFNKFFDLSNEKNIDILQSEIGFFSKKLLKSSFFNFISLNIHSNNYFTKYNKTSNINIISNIYNIKNYNLLVPKKLNFEQNSMFINIFGYFSDFTFVLYKTEHRTLKNEWNIFKFFFRKLKIKNRFFLSKIKSRFIPKKWLYLYISLNIYDFKENKFILVNKNNDLLKNLKFTYNFLDKFTIDLFKKNTSVFFDFFKINSIGWLF